MFRFEKLNKVEFNMAGQDVWMGDPCYVVPSDFWTEFVDKIYTVEDAPETLIGEREVTNLPALVTVTHQGKDYQMIVFSTAFGDGLYALDGAFKAGDNMLGVDSGLLSIIPMELVRAFEQETEALRLGAVCEGMDAIVKFPEEGAIQWGFYAIYTSYDPYEDEDEDEWGSSEDDYDEAEDEWADRYGDEDYFDEDEDYV